MEKLLSHPGKELSDHLENVRKLGISIFENKYTFWNNNSDIKKMLEIILYYHDCGKATVFFQEYIQDVENKKYKKSPFKNYKSHSILSAYLTFYTILKAINNKKLAFFGFYIVRYHHDNIHNFNDDNFLLDENLFNIQINNYYFDYFKFNFTKNDFINFIIKYFTTDNNFDLICNFQDIVKNLKIDDYLLINYIFSILISSDKGDAIFNEKQIDLKILYNIKLKILLTDNKLVDNYKVKLEKSKKIDKIRNKIYSEVENNLLKIDINKNKIFSINVPTGSGKTLTVFNFALKLKTKLQNKSKIIYTLPFTSIIDQNYEVFSKVLGDLSNNSSILLKHHYLAEKKYLTTNEEIDSEDYNITEYLIENWDSEIIVTTFVQLLDTIFSNNNRKLKKFNNLANSIIILDEVQSIPYEYWELINKLFIELSKKLNCYIILVTATLPLIFNENRNEILELVQNKKDYFSNFNRIVIDKKELKKEYLIDEFFNLIKTDIIQNNEDSFLFVFNTIKSSLLFYNKVKKILSDDYKLIYLSTNIIPKERIDRIKEIKKNKKVIIISTQIIEAGVDIDIDRVYRDLGPLDCINQTAGRCNRNGINKKGIVKLFKLKDDKNLYANYVYKSTKTKSNILIDKTLETLKNFNDEIEEKDFFKISYQYYNLLNESKSDDISLNLLDCIKKLKYSDAFESDKRFEIINNNFKTIDLFIEIDNKASKFWQEYLNILNLPIKFKRKEKFDSIKSDFLSYVISVPEKFFKEGKEGFNFINNKNLNQYYHPSTGFIRSQSQEDYIF